MLSNANKQTNKQTTEKRAINGLTRLDDPKQWQSTYLFTSFSIVDFYNRFVIMAESSLIEVHRHQADDRSLAWALA